MHAASFWEITLATDPTFLTPVLAEFTIAPNLEIFPFTQQILLPSTDYLARVTYFDDALNQTAGLVTSFTTLANGTIPFPDDPWSACIPT